MREIYKKNARKRAYITLIEKEEAEEEEERRKKTNK